MAGGVRSLWKVWLKWRVLIRDPEIDLIDPVEYPVLGELYGLGAFIWFTS